MKTCNKCSKSLSVSLFSKDRTQRDGLQSYCKKCRSAGFSKWRLANLGKVKAFAAAWRKRNPKYTTLRYRADPGPRKIMAAQYRKKYPEKIRARNAARYVKREKHCSQCGALNPEAHHPDYSKPKLIVWLCIPCHKKHHQTTERK